MTSLHEEVRAALRRVNGAYSDFINGCADDVKEHPEKQKELLEYLKAHPEADTGEVIKQIITVIRPEMLDEEDDDEYEEDEQEENQ